MRTPTKVAIATLAAAFGAVALAALESSSVDAREVGRSDPKRAANYRLPWFNFSETYTDGSVLGVRIGSTRAEAIRVAEQAGFEVEPSGWGDSRAGRAGLYSRSAVLEAMARQPFLNFHDASDVKRGMSLRFHGDRVMSVSIHYINSEAF